MKTLSINEQETDYFKIFQIFIISHFQPHQNLLNITHTHTHKIVSKKKKNCMLIRFEKSKTKYHTVYISKLSFRHAFKDWKPKDIGTYLDSEFQKFQALHN